MLTVAIRSGAVRFLQNDGMIGRQLYTAQTSHHSIWESIKGNFRMASRFSIKSDAANESLQTNIKNIWELGCD